ncbi:MAG: O-antigen ligase family protein [Acidiferrobacter sp.]
MLMPQMARTKSGPGGPSRAWDAGRVIETPLANRLTLASMFVFLAKIGNLPYLGHYEIGKVLIGLSVLALLFEGGGWKEGVLSHPVMRSYLGLFTIALLTIPIAVWPGGSARFLFGNYLKDMVLVILLIVTTRTARDVRRLMWTVIINTLILDAILLHYGDQNITIVHLGKNEIAMTSVIAFGMLLGLPTTGIGKILKWAAGIMLIVGIFMSVSRGSYLGVSAVLMLYMFLRFGRRAGLAVVGSAVIALSLLVGAYEFGPPKVHHAISTLIHIKKDYNLTARTGRIAIWKRGLKIVKDHPLGVGMRNFPIAEGHLVEDVIGERWMDAHNALLEVTAELGILGGVVFLILLKRGMQTANRLRKNSETEEMARVGLSLVLGLFGYFVTAAFLSEAYAVILYIQMAAIISADRVYSYAMIIRKGNVLSQPSA